MRPERRACLRLLESEKRRPGLDQGDLATEARERLAEFDADGASAEDRQRHRQFRRNRRLTVGPEIDAVQARDGRDRCGAAIGDDHGAAREDLLVANLHRPLIDQFAFASHEPGSGRLHRGGRTAVVEVARHPQHACGHFRKVDGPVHA